MKTITIYERFDRIEIESVNEGDMIGVEFKSGKIEISTVTKVELDHAWKNQLQEKSRKVIGGTIKTTGAELRVLSGFVNQIYA